MSNSSSTPNADLLTIVDEKSANIRTKTADYSFNELVDMHRSGELIIRPDYQRLFRWSQETQSRFIESLVLEMPIPPIYMIEARRGEYELIDGLQRISTYLHLRGELQLTPDNKLKIDDDDVAEAEADGGPPQDQEEGVEEERERDGKRYLVLAGCDIVKELNGKTFLDLPQPIQIKLKRVAVRAEVIRKESDQKLRYHMFKRLNTGGELLSEQEIRNCTMRLLSDDFSNFIISLSQEPSYVECMRYLSDAKRQQKVDQEFVLRFFAFKNNRSAYRHEVREFMTSFMEGISEKAITFDYDDERRVFRKTFEIASKALGDAPFSAVDVSGKVLARFSAYPFEAFTLGIQAHIDGLNPSNESQMKRLGEAFRALKQSGPFRAVTKGGGQNYAGPLKKRIELTEKCVKRAL